MAYKITGKIIEIGQPQALNSKSGKPFVKRDLVIGVRMFDSYTGQPTDSDDNTPKFTFFGDKGKDLDQFKAGDIVTVDFDVRGRSYVRDNKLEYATDVNPFKVRPYVNPAQAAPQQYAEPAAPQPMAEQFPQGFQQQGSVDDIPF